MKLRSFFTVVGAMVTGVGALAAMTQSVNAAEKIDLVLNWFPTADHSPYFYALDQDWYKQAGIDLTISTGKGSGIAAQRVGTGGSQFGVADLPTAMVARGEGADLVAVMAVYENSPQGFYWDNSKTSIKGPKDFPGHSVGNPPGDASRVMWPAFANAVGIPADSVKFINISPQAKMSTLVSGRVDIISDFYNGHDLKIKTLGANMGYVSWRSVGVNPYGNSVIVNGKYLQAHRDIVDKFVKVTQKAFHACAVVSKPCLDSLFAHVSGLDRTEQELQWNRVMELMTTKETQTIALGYLDPKRVEGSLDLVKKYFKLQDSYPASAIFTDDFLSHDITVPSKS